MGPWQALRARGALRTARDRALGPGRVGGQALASGYSLGPCDGMYDGGDAAHGPVRAFSLGGDNRNTMQDLNWRMASYMDKVQSLEAANGTLEMQIAELLERKSPDDLIKLDRYLDTVNTLHSQITECQTAEAQTKLQLVSLVLVASDLSARLDAEQANCGQRQTHVRDLSLVGEQLLSSTLPGLSDLLGCLTLELAELQAHHLQDVQCLRARAAGDISVQLACATSPKLSHQLEMFRDGSVDVMVHQNRVQNNHWFNSQVATLPREEEEPPLASSSDVLQTEVNNLRTSRLMLEEELNQLQTQHLMLEENDVRLMEGYSMQLTQLQHRADCLGQQLHSVQQATCQQAEEFLTLLHIKSGLDKELEDYAALLELRHDRTLISSHLTMTSALPLNIQRSGTAFQRTAMMEGDRRVVAQSRTLGSGSELKARESHAQPITTNQATCPVTQTSALHISESTSTQTSIPSNQVTLAKDAPKKYSKSATSITTSALPDRSSTSFEIKSRSVSAQTKGPITASEEEESKTGKEMKQCILPEGQVQSPQTATKQSVIVEPRMVKEITGTTLEQQVTKQVTNTTTEIIVQNTFLLQATTKTAQPETHTVSVVETRLETAHATPPQLSSTSSDMQTRGINANVFQINSAVLKASIPADTIRTEVVGRSTVVDLKGSEAQRTERQTEEEIHVVNHTSLTTQGSTTDVCQKSESVEIRGFGSHLEKTIQENTGGDSVGQARSSLDDACVSMLVDIKVQMEGDTTAKGSSVDTPCLVDGNVVNLQASMVTQVEDSSSKVGGNAEGSTRIRGRNKETDVDFSNAPLLAGTPMNKEEADNAEQGAMTSHASYDIGFSNNTFISANPIQAITDECPIVEKKEDSVKMNSGVPQEQSIAIVETVVHAEIEEVDTMLHASHSPLPDLSITTQGEPVCENVEVDAATFGSDASVEVNQTDQGASAIEVETGGGVSSVDEAVSCEVVTVVYTSQTHPETTLSLKDAEMCLSLDATEEFSHTTTPGVSELQCVTTRDSYSLLSQVDSNQDEPGPLGTNETTNQSNLEACMTDTEVMIQKELDTCFSPVDGDVKTQNEMDTCFSPDDNDAMTPDELRMCFSPVDNTNRDILRPTQSETPLRPVKPVFRPEGLELCFSPVDQDNHNQHELEACMSPVDNDVLSPNQDEACFSPVDNNDIMSPIQNETCFSPVDNSDILSPNQNETCFSPVDNSDILSPNQNETCFSPVDNSDILSPNQNETCFSPVDNNDIQSQNELEGCFSPVGNDLLSPNELEACFSPVDNDLLSPNGLECCLSPDTQKLHNVDRGLCFSPSDDVRESPTRERIRSPVNRYILSTKVDNQSLSFSGNLGLTEKNKASKVSELPKERNRFTKSQSLGFISKTDTVSRDVPNSWEGRYRNRSIEGIGQEAFSLVGSPPENRYRKLSLGGKEDNRFHSITRGTLGVSSNKSVDGQKSTGLPASRTSPGSSLLGESSHCFRSVPLTRGASFSSCSGTAEDAKGTMEGMPAVRSSRATSPGGRLFSTGSGEWKVYGGGTSRTSNGGSASGSSVGSGGRLARSGSGDRISRAVSSYAQSSSRRYGSTGSGESKTVYGSASGRISGAVRQGSMPGGNRAPSPATGRKLGSSTGGSGGRLSSAFGSGGGRMSSASSGGKHSLSGSSDRLSGGQALRISSPSGHTRTNSTGGRVISSSDRPAISAGSGVGANKERISVCKRAALSISAAGRERSQEKHRSGQRLPSANNPRIQHWVTTGIGGAVEGLDDQDDILNL